MKNIIMLALVAALTACGQNAATHEKPKSQAIIVLIENGGTVAQEDQAAALDTALHLFEQLTRLVTWSNRPGHSS